MSVPFSNTKLRVPQGFQTLLEMLSKEILRQQPKNIYQFSADYIDALVKNRGRQSQTSELFECSIGLAIIPNNDDVNETFQV